MNDAFNGFRHALWTATDLVRQQPEVALLVGVGLHLFLLLLMLLLWVRTLGVVKRQQALMRGANGQSIEELLLAQVGEADAVRGQLADALRGGQQNADLQKQSLQRIGLVRFDAFPDVGGEQSFALALLDEGGSGLVLTGLHSRHDMRVYAKPVTRGTSPVNLSDEEKKAIASAQPASDEATEAKGIFRPRRPRPVG